ncbi:gliding motility protein [Streptomyces sp. NPDC032472]|uniref:gliding motility protein n=1 Tax=Streptomyces sp. NPDC032472 TaxID=3155018 RepID=UPI0033E815A4
MTAETQSVESGAAADEAAGTGAEPAEAGAPAAEAVEIPKQQSAEAAADSEAGESART